MPRSSARSKRSGGWRRSGRNDRPWTHRRRFVLGRFVVKLFVHAARVPVCSVTTRSWPSGTPQSRPHKSLSSNCLGAQHRVSSIERVGKFSGGRLRRVADGVGSGLFREAVTNGCPSGEERTPRSVDRGVFHFRGGVAGIWSMGGVRAVVSHLSLGGPGRSSNATANTGSRCLSLLVSPRELSLVKRVRPNESPPTCWSRGLGVWPAARPRQEDASC
jgi:hypothetical protein